MSAIDEIRDAIDTLEALKATRLMVPDFYPGLSTLGEWRDATECIVTLHRTIDAQLTALRMAVDYLANGFHEDSGVPQIGIGIARAINGVTS